MGLAIFDYTPNSYSPCSARRVIYTSLTRIIGLDLITLLPPIKPIRMKIGIKRRPWVYSPLNFALIVEEVGIGR